MINKDRIVPATAQDLLGIYLADYNLYAALNSGTRIEAVSAIEIGLFNADDFASGGFADEPIKELALGTETVFTAVGVLDYDFKGVTKNGVEIELTNANGYELVGDGCTPYVIHLASGSVGLLNVITGEAWAGTVGE